MIDVEAGLRREIIEIGRALIAKGLVTGTAGNISARIPDSPYCLVTPSGMDYAKFGPEDLCRINLDSGAVEGARRPSIETGLHSEIMRRRPDAGAIVHTHSLYATAVAITRRALPCILDAMPPTLGGEVPCAEYATPGSPELARHAADALEGHNATLLANHGVVAIGASLQQALERAELVERAAQTLLASAAFAPAVPIDPDSIAKSREFFKTSYGQVRGEAPGE